MKLPHLLDLFCGAGGSAVGYHTAGFEVHGVDINRQPNYPFIYTQADALEILELIVNRKVPHRKFDAIHASPPCQAFTAYRRTGVVGDYPNLIPQTRELLEASGLPWVIENVKGAPLENPLMLCGSMFDLDVQRHRYFESNIPLEPPMWSCRHKIWSRRFKSSTGRKPNSRFTIEVGSWDEPLTRQHQAMGIDWMALEELSEAIPPAYTEFIGRQLYRHITEKVAA